MGLHLAGRHEYLTADALNRVWRVRPGAPEFSRLPPFSGAAYQGGMGIRTVHLVSGGPTKAGTVTWGVTPSMAGP